MTRKIKKSQIAIEWIEKYLVVPEGRLVGHPIKLAPEQKKWLRDLYDSPTRTFILSIPRKNGKTSFCAMILLLHLVGPFAQPNASLYSVANSRDQAAILFNLAYKMVRQSASLARYIRAVPSSKRLECDELGTIYQALSRDVSTSFGLSPALVIVDELGQTRGPRNELFESMQTATAAQENPLTVIISTQAPTDADLLSVLIDDAQTKKDPTTKLVLYSAPESMDAFSLEAIKVANPLFGYTMNKEEVLKMAEAAKRMPSRESSYRNLVLNQRINLQNPFVSKMAWKACSGEPDEAVFHEHVVYIGLDLSQRNDLTALVAITQDDDGVWHVICEFFAPAMGLEDRIERDRAPYDLWAKQGVLTLTPGAIVDYSFVAQRLIYWCENFPVGKVFFDRWRMDQLKGELTKLDAELPLVAFGQGFKSMSPALEVLEAIIVEKRMRHGNNPILNMCAVNATVQADPAGNRKLVKSKATGRIDGMIALTMAVGGSQTETAAWSNDEEFDSYISAPLVIRA